MLRVFGPFLRHIVDSLLPAEVRFIFNVWVAIMLDDIAVLDGIGSSNLIPSDISVIWVESSAFVICLGDLKWRVCSRRGSNLSKHLSKVNEVIFIAKDLTVSLSRLDFLDELLLRQSISHV